MGPIQFGYMIMKAWHLSVTGVYSIRSGCWW
jgi:hypothetical protein